ncbi:hypothetical protein QBC45DRAFT_99710 [Copromyces sp. CBS 386.78]|nr:hypothetical protein QBC45DRAFT_99710 [Copromyces sp. CBS 386.78]
MFMLYHVQKLMWLCDFDELGLAEDYKKKISQQISPIMSKLVYYHFSPPLLRSFISPRLFLPLSSSYQIGLCVALGLFLANQLSLLSSYLTTFPSVLSTLHLLVVPFLLSIYPSSINIIMSCSSLVVCLVYNI